LRYFTDPVEFVISGCSQRGLASPPYNLISAQISVMLLPATCYLLPAPCSLLLAPCSLHCSGRTRRYRPLHITYYDNTSSPFHHTKDAFHASYNNSSLLTPRSSLLFPHFPYHPLMFDLRPINPHRL